MATLTTEQIEQKKQQLMKLAEEMKTLTKELVEAGAIELSDNELENVSGGWFNPITEKWDISQAGPHKPKGTAMPQQPDTTSILDLLKSVGVK